MLTRWNDFSVWPSLGFRDFPRWSRDLERLLYAVERPREFLPRVTFEERADAWVMKSEVPGFSEEDIDLRVTGSTVTFKLERASEAKPDGAGPAAPTYRFERTFELPAKVEPEHVEATLKLGILTVTLPKASEAQPKQIPVKAG